MKRLSKIILLLLLLGLILIFGVYVKKKYYDPRRRYAIANEEVKKITKNKKIHEGDIIFQTSISRQSKAIQQATHSKYSHCGIIFVQENKFLVLEAVQPVKYTPLNKWIAKGQNAEYIIKRLKNSDRIITPDVLQKMKSIGDEFIGKKYDICFEWTDEKMYCSELIWKIYKRAANVEIGKLQKLKDFDLSSEAVKQKMNERYGDNIPYNETVISPSDIFDSKLLETIESNH